MFFVWRLTGHLDHSFVAFDSSRIIVFRTGRCIAFALVAVESEIFFHFFSVDWNRRFIIRNSSRRIVSFFDHVMLGIDLEFNRSIDFKSTIDIKSTHESRIIHSLSHAYPMPVAFEANPICIESTTCEGRGPIPNHVRVLGTQH